MLKGKSGWPGVVRNGVAGLAALLALLLPDAGSGQSPDFRRDVLPILSNSCFVCHGPDEGDRQAGLRLDLRDEAISAGAFQPGSAASSELVRRINSPDDADHMPPLGTRPDLTAAERELLERWIDAGAAYEEHWAWKTPTRPAVPESGAGWARNPVDHFVAAARQREGLPAAPRAGLRTLLRRLCLDLAGLPPATLGLTPERFGLADGYDQAVEALLASPHFGERMAPAWLDVVRYADTVGYHGDQNQNVFPYRDWVVQAFNDNLPFDRFIRMQLAGDLLPDAGEDCHVATAFNRLNMVTREGGAQPDEYLAKYSADRVRTVGTAFLGVTTGCAECHDHKFDPFTQRDFYSLAAFFADIREWGVYQDYDYTPNPDLRGWSNDHPFPPEREVAVPALARRLERLIAERDTLVQQEWQAAVANPERQELLRNWARGMQAAMAASQTGWVPLTFRWPEPSPGEGGKPVPPEPPVGQEPGGTIRLVSELPKTLKVEFEAPRMELSSLRIEFPGDPDSKERAFPAKSGRSTIHVQIWRHYPESAQKKPERVRVHFADGSPVLPRYANGFAIDGIDGGWQVRGDAPAGAGGCWLIDRPMTLKAGEWLSLTITGSPARRLRISGSPLVPLDPRVGSLLAIDWAAVDEWIGEQAGKGPGQSGLPTPAWWADAAWAWSSGSFAAPATQSRIRELQREIRACRNGRWPVLVTEAVAAPRPIRVLPRGNWQDTSGAIVQPGTPGFLPAPRGAGDSARMNRLDLANWLLQDDHPLTARVQMNRLWKHFFGQPLSGVVDDLGAQGQFPSHPELLDWLAVEFRESGWDFKHMVRLIVGSATYQQSCQPPPSAAGRDPANRWLSHQNARRLEAEIVRDQALAVSGLLNREVGGPPVFPYQPPGYYAQLQFPDRDWHASAGDQQYRRGLYTHWQRTFLHPMLANFDAPSREECSGQRIEANTPQQALTLLNDPTFVEAAIALACRSFAAVPPPSGSADPSAEQAIIAWMLEEVLGRNPAPGELESLTQFLADVRSDAARTPEPPVPRAGLFRVPDEIASRPAELAARAALARVLLNLHETITRY